MTANGLSTTRWFEYGTSTRYGSKTPSASAGSGVTATSVSVGVKSLRAATTYHYRLVAQNSSGKTFGADRSFSTVGAPAVQTGSAQGVGPDLAVLDRSAFDTKGRATTWWFDYGTSASYGKSTSSKAAGSTPGVQKVSATLTGLTPATIYHYRLVAKSDAGTTVGADGTFTTAGVTLTALARQVVFGGRITLSGIVPTHQTGEQVVIYAQTYGGGSFQSRSTVLTGLNGTWACVAKPGIATTYEASWRGRMRRTRLDRRASVDRPAPDGEETVRSFMSPRSRSFAGQADPGPASRERALVDDQAGASSRRARSPGRISASSVAERSFDRPDRVQRQSGRSRVPRRQEPRDHRQALEVPDQPPLIAAITSDAGVGFQRRVECRAAARRRTCESGCAGGSIGAGLAETVTEARPPLGRVQSIASSTVDASTSTQRLRPAKSGVKVPGRWRSAMGSEPSPTDPGSLTCNG